MTDTATPLPFTLANHDEAPTRGGSSLDAMSCSGSLDLRLGDCMELMKTFPDGHFDLAIVDPPYGIGASEMQMGKGKNKKWTKGKGWDTATPDAAYFAELERVSKRRIVWGGNYFALPSTGGWLFWDKDKGKDTSFADGELAWTNFLTTLKKVTVRYDGFIGADSERIHPTQKPVRLYDKIFASFAKPGERVLDTHMGSGSIAIAAHYAGVHLTACEIDPEYFAAASARIDRETRQTELFSPQNVVVHTSATGGASSTRVEGCNGQSKSDSGRVADCGATPCSPD